MLRPFMSPRRFRVIPLVGALLCLLPGRAWPRTAPLTPTEAQILRRATAQLTRGEEAEAVRALHRLTAAHPRDAALHFTVGMLLAGAGQFGTAVPEFKATAALHPDYAVYYNLGLCDSHLQRWDAAHAAYFHVLDLAPGSFEPQFRLGLDYLAQNKAYLAIPWLLKAHQLQPRNTTVYFLLGDAYLREGYGESAVRTLKQLLELTPNDARALANLGDAYVKDNHYAEALAAYQAAERNAPKIADLPYDVGQVQLALEHGSEAEASFRRALALNPAHVRSLAALGHLELDRGQLDAAEADLRHALQLSPAQTEARFDLSKLLLQRRAPAEAAALLQALVQELPADRRFHYQLSRAFRATGETAAADRELRAFQELDAASRQPRRVHPQTYVE